ncbi:restriction endonuclease subunit S [Aeromonas salmonicida]|uniref:restriction endonuclease subunit S n=1 Tax=Aeromonas salmonicida TaxID=645 RepID=UPI0028666FE2|nr:restriction endonuclease subunit S [Aeromonas salmonicida]MDR7022107.1 type I restriction enzyme S subunit [Aeromonas salmonicida]
MAALKIENLITDHLDLWSAAVRPKSSAGRGNNSKLELTGIKKLRELILELAVRGKLVPQDPSDEPASVLLERIAAEKARLVKEEGLRTSANEVVNIADEYIECPRHWKWARLGNIAKFIDYRGKTPNKIDAGVRLITAKNIRYGYIDLIPEEFISEADYEQWMTRGFPRVGDTLFTTEAPLGNAAVIDINERFALAQRAICFQWHYSDISRFMLIQILASPFQNQLLDNSSGMTATGVKASRLKEIPVVVPPAEEQHRIVAKVDELMALCDQLEQRSESQLAAHQTLVEALLATLTDSCDADELAQNWARLSTHFDTLFTTEASIDALKQTILQLTVTGTLVSWGNNVREEKLKNCISFGPRNGFSPKETTEDTGFYVLKLGATSYGSLNLAEIKKIDVAIEKESHLFIRKNDILIQRGNSANYVGSNCLVECDVDGIIYPDLMMKITVNHKVSAKYLSLWLSSPRSRHFMWDRMTGTSGTMPKISKKVVEEIPVMVPLMACQNDIVAKVDELMTLGDQLKSRLQTSQQTQLALAESLVAGALS